jgi:hypothetical protein
VRKYHTIYKEVEVEVELDDFDDEDLIEELENRGRGFDVPGITTTELLMNIWLKRRMNKDYQTELDELIYVGLGKVL